MQQEGVIIEKDGYFILTEDYIFSSSSTKAAGVTLARSASGPLEWKTAKGVQLKSMES